MKSNRLISTATAILLLLSWYSASAQSTLSREDMRRIKMENVNKRDASKKWQHLTLPQQQTPIPATKSSKGVLPEGNVWFPGEWEEVKAIVVTCYYDYLVPGHEDDYTYYADPMVSGVAEYYKYNTQTGNSTSQGRGPYIPSLDSSSTFGKIFFYIMDAIQLGGAEAWVRVEDAADSNIVLRTLERLELRHDNVRFLVGTGNSFWYRDCGPICFYHGDQDEVAMLDFGYYPGRALDDSLPAIIHRQMGINNYITTIEWEGGNCLVDGAGMVLSSDAIYENNTDTYGQLSWDGSNPSSIQYTSKPSLTQAKVKDSLAALIGHRATYILPAFRYDGGTGHIDLYVDMWNENGFVFSKFPSAYSNWTDYKTAAKNIDSLTSYLSVFDRNYSESYIPFPCTNNGGNFSSQNAYDKNFTRTYSNHTFVNNVIIQPVFSNVVNGEPSAEWDRLRLDSIRRAYPGYTLYPINVREFDGSGGAIHCVTKQIPADNPIRILHKNITGCQNSMIGSDIPVAATVTNRSGIAHCECIYRIDGGQWQTINLTGSGDNYSGAFPTASIAMPPANQSRVVEYYISATSNNGKTITKPMTAANGGYFSFFFGTDAIQSATEIDNHFGQFFPNPASDVAHIEINAAAKYDVQIIDLAGRTVHKTSFDASNTGLFNINTSRLAKGVYNVVFSCPNGHVTRKLIVQ